MVLLQILRLTEEGREIPLLEFYALHSKVFAAGAKLYQPALLLVTELRIILPPRRQARKEVSFDRREQRKQSFLIHLCYLRYVL
jgi:hypothetical protein